jgi:hypothetical protein
MSIRGKSAMLATLALAGALTGVGGGLYVAEPVDPRRPTQSEDEKAERIRRAQEKRARRAARNQRRK